MPRVIVYTHFVTLPVPHPLSPNLLNPEGLQNRISRVVVDHTHSNCPGKPEMTVLTSGAPTVKAY